MLWDTDVVSMIVLSNVTKFYSNGTRALDVREVVDTMRRRVIWIERGRLVRDECGSGYEG